jgi:hypothetical protein
MKHTTPPDVLISFKEARGEEEHGRRLMQFAVSLFEARGLRATTYETTGDATTGWTEEDILERWRQWGAQGVNLILIATGETFSEWQKRETRAWAIGTHTTEMDPPPQLTVISQQSLTEEHRNFCDELGKWGIRGGRVKGLDYADSMAKDTFLETGKDLAWFPKILGKILENPHSGRRRDVSCRTVLLMTFVADLGAAQHGLLPLNLPGLTKDAIEQSYKALTGTNKFAREWNPFLSHPAMGDAECEDEGAVDSISKHLRTNGWNAVDVTEQTRRGLELADRIFQHEFQAFVEACRGEGVLDVIVVVDPLSLYDKTVHAHLNKLVKVHDRGRLPSTKVFLRWHWLYVVSSGFDRCVAYKAYLDMLDPEGFGAAGLLPAALLDAAREAERARDVAFACHPEAWSLRDVARTIGLWFPKPPAPVGNIVSEGATRATMHGGLS